MMPIHIDESDWVPPDLRERLVSHHRDFVAVDHGDDIVRQVWFRDIAADLESLCVQRGFIAYHCTRELYAGEVVSRGLRILEGGGNAHRAEFLARHGDNFSDAEMIEIKIRFAEVWGNGRFSRGRENRLCFGLVHPRYWGGGCDDLLDIFGGEAIYATWGRTGPIVDKLRLIGRPAVVYFRVARNDIVCHHEFPLGRSAIWAWHKRLRPDLLNYWVEGHVKVPIPAGDIVRVEEWTRKG